jgi:hypothetical protein
LGWSKNSIHLHETIRLGRNVNVNRYKTTIDRKVYYISIVQCTIRKKDIYKHVKANLDWRNKFLHCSIMDANDYALDLTQTLREFVYHYDKTDEHSLLQYFFEFVQHKFGTILETRNYDFVLYMNDDEFTERRYPLQECFDKKYIDII